MQTTGNLKKRRGNTSGWQERAGGRNLPPPPAENAHTGLGKLWFLTPLTPYRSGQHRKAVSFTGGSFKKEGTGDMPETD